MQKLILVLAFCIATTLSGCGYFLGTTVTEEMPDLSKKWEKDLARI